MNQVVVRSVAKAMDMVKEMNGAADDEWTGDYKSYGKDAIARLLNDRMKESICQVFLKLDKSAFLCASSLAPRTLGLLFLYAVEIGKEIALFSIPTATTT